MLGQALDWLAVAQDCFTDDYGTLTRGLLTSAFAPFVGLERLWHLDDMEDLGFALLTGGRRSVPTWHWRLARSPALVRGRRFLPAYLSVASGAGRRRPGQLR
jgi:hypothetical protein